MHIRRFHELARAASVVTVLVGCAGVLGWVFDIDVLKSPLSGRATMKMNTALCFVLSGFSMGLQLAPTSVQKSWMGRMGGSLVAAVGLLTLIEYALDLNIGIDQLLIRADIGVGDSDSPGRMAANTALSFVLAGTALVFLDKTSGALRSISHVLAMMLLVIGFVAVTGHALSATALYGVAGYSSMAIHTALGFVALSTALLASRPEHGVVAILAQDNTAGATVRRLVPIIVVTPLVVAWLQLQGRQAHLYSTEFALALMVTVTTGSLAAFALWNARVHGAWEAERKRASEQFRLAIDAAPTGMLLIDNVGKIVLLNVQAERLFGYRRQDLLGSSVEMLVPERFRARHREHRQGFAENPQARPMGAGRELYGLRSDGVEVPIEIGLTPIETPEGKFVLSSAVDITDRRRAEQEREELVRQLKELNNVLEQRVRERTAALTATLREREVLLQEVHHRVKNNLYVIVSLMEMQARVLSPGDGRSALEDCQGRVHAMALIHEKLYHSKNYADVPFADYLRDLTGDIFNATGVSPSSVTLAVTVDDVAITVEKAIPCGLILNELITNALKHAYSAGRQGTLRVELKVAGGGRLRLVVADDGVGLPSDWSTRDTKSLGLRLVHTLAEQLDGELAVKGDAGTTFELTFPVSPPAATDTVLA